MRADIPSHSQNCELIDITVLRRQLQERERLARRSGADRHSKTSRVSSEKRFETPRLRQSGSPEDCFVALEATGHYWRNLVVSLIAKGYAVAVLNPLRTRRFAEEELERTKTDAIDALGSLGLPHRSGRREPCCQALPPQSCTSCFGRRLFVPNLDLRRPR